MPFGVFVPSFAARQFSALKASQQINSGGIRIRRLVT